MKLEELFRKLGCEDPEGWAASEVEENIPQLARYRFLALTKEIIEYYSKNAKEWIETEIKKNPHDNEKIGQVLELMLEKGIDHNQIGLVAMMIAWDSIARMIEIMDDPHDYKLGQLNDELPSWELIEIDKDGNPTGRTVDCLTESIDEVINLREDN